MSPDEAFDTLVALARGEMLVVFTAGTLAMGWRPGPPPACDNVDVAIREARDEGIAVGAMRAARALGEQGLADEIAVAVARKLKGLARVGAPVVPPDDAFVDQDAGLFDREVYLRLARRGEFPVSKVGKKRVARWGDVKAGFLKKCVPVTISEPTDDPELDLLNEIRQRAGLRVRGGR